MSSPPLCFPLRSFGQVLFSFNSFSLILVTRTTAITTTFIITEALPGGGGGPMYPIWILKRLVSVFINACRLLSALPSLSQFGRGRLSLVTISFYALSLLFGRCRLSEFTLAGPHYIQLENATFFRLLMERKEEIVSVIHYDSKDV